MSIILTVSLNKKIDLPDWMEGWYTQVLFDYVYEAQGGPGVYPDTIGELAKHFKIKIQPLLKVGGQNFSLEEYGGNIEVFERMKKHNQACWQPPQKLIDCLIVFIEKLESNPEIFSQLIVKDNYFLEGHFKKDLIDLMNIAKWANENGVKKLKLEIG